MKHQPYSLYKRTTKDGSVWYVRFWNAREQRYTLTRSTGVPVLGMKGRFREAEEAARKILKTLNYSPTKKTVLQYLSDFWKEDSPYFQERAKLKNKPVTKGYIKKMQGIIKNHIFEYPAFKKLPLVELTAGSIKDWMIWLSDRGTSNLTIDKALLAIKVPVKEAVNREELKRNSAKKVKSPFFTYSEKGILKPDEVKLLIKSLTERDMRIAIFLGVLCGMRMGEIRGLRYEDIVNDEIFIQNNYQDLDGNKAPKWNSKGVIYLPEILKPDIRSGEGYVFTNRNKKSGDKPACAGYFRRLFIRSLEQIGISASQQAARNLSFHSLRHTFVTLGRIAGISVIEMQALARHKSARMTEHYSHPAQIIDIGEAREKGDRVLREALCERQLLHKSRIFVSKKIRKNRLLYKSKVHIL